MSNDVINKDISPQFPDIPSALKHLETLSMNNHSKSLRLMKARGNTADTWQTIQCLAVTRYLQLLVKGQGRYDASESVAFMLYGKCGFSYKSRIIRGGSVTQ
jgi:hypothetical protein